MSSAEEGRTVVILLVEDNPGDIRLTKEALRQAKVVNHLHSVRTGEDALAFLNRKDEYADAPRPDIVLLDLNLPRMNGRDVLREIKTDAELRTIPVIVLSTSAEPSDIEISYRQHANCYIRKPPEMAGFRDVMSKIDDFWFSVARLPEV